MKFKKLMLCAAMSFTLPTLAFADIQVNNNTSAYATGYMLSTCSSVAGSSGIAAPHSSITIPQTLVDIYCKRTCQVQVFMSQDCSGPKVATVDIDQHKGVTSIKNYNINGYVVSGSGDVVSIDGGPTSLFDFLFN